MTTNGTTSQSGRQAAHQEPYTESHPVPTVQNYRERKSSRADDDSEDGAGLLHTAANGVKRMAGRDPKDKTLDTPYPSENRNTASKSADQPSSTENDTGTPSSPSPSATTDHDTKIPSREEAQESDTQTRPQPMPQADLSDLRTKGKGMRKARRDDEGREVTDPVTHLPVIIRDSTDNDLKSAPKNEPAAGVDHRTQTGPSAASKSDTQLQAEEEEQYDLARNNNGLFPPPNYDQTRAALVADFQMAAAAGIGSALVFALLGFVTAQLWSVQGEGKRDEGFHRWQSMILPISVTLALSSMAGGLVAWGVIGWLGKRVREIWDDQVWSAARARENQQIADQDKLPESTQWLNSLFTSVWPLINPDLFTGLADTLEDVMQASLPKVVRMISVDDLGQGSEALRVLGIRWLPTGAASASAKSASRRRNNQKSPAASGEKQDDDPDEEAEKEDDDGIGSGMEAEEGDFVNMEVAFAYRARSSGKSLQTKSKNAHIFLKFYMPGSIAVPVWVEVRGVVGTMRMRLQLSPDPPFLAQATVTFMGQPKVDISCLPLSKHSLNIMDVPLISSFVQSCVDAALAEYVAPKSLTLDLKAMLVGDDFKKDTAAHGVIVVCVKKAVGFKEGDGSLGPLKEGSSDAYVTTGWGKFGKAVASTRIILEDQEPVWDEYTYAMVTTQELNAQEMLRMTIWDSDRTTADDDLGRVEVDLKSLMRNPKTKGKMCDREDRFRGPDGHEMMPGTLYWSVGYFAKANITPSQLAAQTEEPDITSIEDLKRKAHDSAKQKLREASEKADSRELDQQKDQDFKEREDNLIIASPPPKEYPSGLLSIQIHQITGLEMQKLRKKRSDKAVMNESDELDQDSDDLPSAYCTFILNHSTVFQTRTKPKNNKPFFNAGYERFIKDWRSTELIISVRDSRVHENDPLLGVVYLPLSRVLERRSQIVDVYPLVGGIGHGRARVSLVFRAVELQVPRELLGWEYGTLEVMHVEAGKELADDVRKLKVRFSSGIASRKMAPEDGSGDREVGSVTNQTWKSKHRHDKTAVYIPFKARYSTPLMIEFYKSTMLTVDSTPAFAVFWLKDIADEEKHTITLPVWRGSKAAIKRGRSCADYDGMEPHEEPLGQLKVTMKFWRGLSGYHARLAGRASEAKLRSIMEVLDCANDNKEGKGRDDRSPDDEDELDESAAPDTSSSSSSSDASDFDDDQAQQNDAPPKSAPANLKSKVTNAVLQPSNSTSSDHQQEDGKRNPAAQAQEYRRHRKTLHRRHRGLMQWKGVRTLEWAADRADRGKEWVVGGMFKRDGGDKVRTEV